MAKVATISEHILSRKGKAQPMAATGPLTRASAPASIDWHVVANSLAPPTLRAAPAVRRDGRDGKASRRAEPRVRVSLRLDRDRHARFKSFCALAGRSQQSVLMQALDRLLACHGLDEAAGDRRRPLPE